MSNYSNIMDTNETSTSTWNSDLINKILNLYILNGVLIVGTILNFISILVFFKIIKEERSNQGNMFKYLFMKCLCDFFLVLLSIPDKLIHNDTFIQVLFLKLNRYFLENIFSTSSSFYEMASSLDCLFLISRKIQWFKNKIVFYLLVVLITFSTVVYHIPGLFRFQIVKKQNGLYHLEDSPFKSSAFIKHYFLAFHFVFRDGLPLVFSLLVNSLIVYYLKQRTKMRQILASNKQTSLVYIAHASEMKKVKLTIFTSLLVLLRIPSMINVYVFNYLNFSFSKLSLFFTYFSFSVSYFGFVLYNNNFRRICSRSILIFLNFFRRS
jgi:hypothetical protein